VWSRFFCGMISQYHRPDKYKHSLISYLKFPGFYARDVDRNTH
jgi:hypothetical protein